MLAGESITNVDPLRSPPKTAGKRGTNQPIVDYVTSTDDPAVTEIVTYNTGYPVKLDNVSHAENVAIEFSTIRMKCWARSTRWMAR